jgi:hypothetical protein
MTRQLPPRPNLEQIVGKPERTRNIENAAALPIA